MPTKSRHFWSAYEINLLITGSNEQDIKIVHICGCLQCNTIFSAAMKEPHLTKNISETDLQKMIIEIPDKSHIIEFLCHSQPVRLEEMVTEKSRVNTGCNCFKTRATPNQNQKTCL